MCNEELMKTKFEGKDSKAKDESRLERERGVLNEEEEKGNAM